MPYKVINVVLCHVTGNTRCHCWFTPGLTLVLDRYMLSVGLELLHKVLCSAEKYTLSGIFRQLTKTLIY